MDVLIIGSGPAAAGVAIALSALPGVTVRVLDVGGRLEETNETARLRMSQSEPGGWSPSDVRTISQVATPTKEHRLPEKRNFGSSFPFDDFGQLEGVTGQGDVNTHVVSGAYGGFSNTWGAQTMVYSAASFADWPFARHELESDYRAILATIPYSGEHDDLAEYFPLWGPADPLPPLSENSTRILDRYERHRLQVRRQGVIVGNGRLALRGSACVSCGLCMTGCPYSYVYSAAQTFDQLIADGRITYIGGYVALRIGEEDERPHVVARNQSTGEVETFHADKIFVGCGAIGTTRLVASSLDMWSQAIHLQESVQFLMPLASMHGTGALSQDGSFTLNQFNIVMPFDEAGRDLVQIHGYPYNKAMDDAVPAPLRLPMVRGLRAMLLKHLTVGLGYLPSWLSPGFDVTIVRPESPDQLAEVILSSTSGSHEQSASRMRAINARLLRVAPYLGVVPVLPMVTLSAPGKSYHFGGSFPHSQNPVAGRESDVLGRVHPWRNVHLVDASVFPTVSATTFTLTIMANAHRIARHVAEDARG
jgi:choline dehydrogenase-like flavoprotein